MNNGSSLRRPIRINSWSYDHDKVYICRFWGIFLEQVTEYVNMIFLKKRAFFNLSSETCLLFGLICQRSSSGHQHLQRGNKVYSVCPRNCMHSYAQPYTLCSPEKTFLQGKHTVLPTVSINQLL